MSEPEPSSSQPRPSRSHRGVIGIILQFTRGLIYDQHQRRLTMFYALLGAMLLAFVGDGLFDAWLRANLLRFVIWLLACCWLTILAALLAVYDLLLLRVQHRIVRRELRDRLRKHIDEGR